MKLDRNTNKQGIGKYALIKLRDVPVGWPKFTENSNGNEFISLPSECVDFGDKPETEFFVIRLKDKYAWQALRAYSDAAYEDDPEYSNEVLELSKKAETHPHKRRPD